MHYFVSISRHWTCWAVFAGTRWLSGVVFPQPKGYHIFTVSEFVPRVKKMQASQVSCHDTGAKSRPGLDGECVSRGLPVALGLILNVTIFGKLVTSSKHWLMLKKGQVDMVLWWL